MLIQDVYEFLWRPRRLENAIYRAVLQKSELESCLLPAAIRYDKDPVQTSPEDTMSRICAEISALENRILVLKEHKAQAVGEISRAIENLPNGSERADMEKMVLSCFFVGRQTMQEVSDNIHYSLKYTYHVRKQAVIHLGEVLENTGKIKVEKKKKKKNNGCGIMLS